MIYKKYIQKFEKYRDVIEKMEKTYNFKPGFVQTFITIESSWDEQAETPWARGLMAVSKWAVKDTNKYYGFSYTYDNMFEPEKNIEVGTAYLALIRDKVLPPLDDELLYISLAVAYNGGPYDMKYFYTKDKTLKSAMKRHSFETLQYGLKFMFYYYRWKQYLISVEGGI